jgi:hypothetical protein
MPNIAGSTSLLTGTAQQVNELTIAIKSGNTEECESVRQEGVPPRPCPASRGFSLALDLAGLHR